MNNKSTRMLISFHPRVKHNLEQAADQTGLSQSTLVNLALIGLVSHFEKNQTKVRRSMIEYSVHQPIVEKKEEIPMPIQIQRQRKECLLTISKEAHLTQSTVVNLAVANLCENYQKKKEEIFHSMLDLSLPKDKGE